MLSFVIMLVQLFLVMFVHLFISTFLPFISIQYFRSNLYNSVISYMLIFEIYTVLLVDTCMKILVYFLYVCKVVSGLFLQFQNFLAL